MGLVVVAIEDSGAGLHGACGLLAGQIVGHYDLLVVGAIGARIGWATDFMNCATFRRACDHKCRWKSLGALVDLLGTHSTRSLAVQGLDQAEEVSLEALWVGFLHSLASLLDTVGLQTELFAVLLLHDQRMLLLHLLVDLRQRLTVRLPLPRLLIQPL